MYAPYVSVAATPAVQPNELLNVDFSYTCPSPRRITNEDNTKKERKGSRLPAAHPWPYLFILASSGHLLYRWRVLR